ncbi:MAG TPA: HlyD family efflux transporter periplasmic adaptor subunit [Kofleriaceae bacterium]|nr:HlyD family efflux transporter periplasmic adaptor subunit [Kofleriaceae bacterium]
MTERTGPSIADRAAHDPLGGALMDLPRTGIRPRTRRAVIAAAAAVALAAITLGVRWLGHRAPVVAREQLWIGAVERGPLTLAVRGQGTLVPTEFRWASAPTAARVDRVLVQPGAAVEAQAVLLELTNPDAELAALTADRDVAQAEAELARLAAQLDGTRLAQESAVAGLDADAAMARRRSTIDTAMAQKGVIADLESLESSDRAGQLAGRLVFEQKRLAALRRGNTAQLAAQRGQLEQLRALAEFRHRQLDALHVRAGQAGVVQQVAVEVGQSVAGGAPLAKIVVPDRLQARLKIAESATQDLALGLAATIDTRTGVVPGEVVRIDPAAQNGSVTVDVRLNAALPRAARVDQNVDGVIELARTGDVLHVARPAIGEAHQTAMLFVLTGAGEARRVQVAFGRAAQKDIEIASGLRAGDQVVLSDMSRWDGVDRLRIE